MTVERQAYRDGMARLAAAVNLITSDGPAGRGGFTASAVCSVTDEPPTLLVCVNRQSRQNDILRANGVLCVNTLAAAQAELAALFSERGRPIAGRYGAGTWTTLATGSPVLEAAVAAFDCRIVERLEKGSHAILLCEVEAVRIDGHAEPLVYFDRAYRALGRTVTNLE